MQSSTHIKTSAGAANLINAFVGKDSNTTAFPVGGLSMPKTAMTEVNTIRTLDFEGAVDKARAVAASSDLSKELVKVVVNGVGFTMPVDADNHTAQQAYLDQAVDRQTSNYRQGTFRLKQGVPSMPYRCDSEKEKGGVASAMLEDVVYTASLVARMMHRDDANPAHVPIIFEANGRVPFYGMQPTRNESNEPEVACSINDGSAKICYVTARQDPEELLAKIVAARKRAEDSD